MAGVRSRDRAIGRHRAVLRTETQEGAEQQAGKLDRIATNAPNAVTSHTPG